MVDSFAPSQLTHFLLNGENEAPLRHSKMVTFPGTIMETFWKLIDLYKVYIKTNGNTCEAKKLVFRSQNPEVRDVSWSKKQNGAK